MWESVMQQAAYAYKHLQPLRLLLVSTIDPAIDPETGSTATTTYEVHIIDRAYGSEEQAAQKFAYDLGYLRANQNFTYGGVFNLKTRSFLVDAKYLPSNFIPKAKMAIICEGKTYFVDKVTGRGNHAWHLETVKTEEAPLLLDALEFELGLLFELEVVG